MGHEVLSFEYLGSSTVILKSFPNQLFVLFRRKLVVPRLRNQEPTFEGPRAAGMSAGALLLGKAASVGHGGQMVCPLRAIQTTARQIHIVEEEF
jgi:hypothetical protein